MTACTQPACTGTIIDEYCDVCGSPAGADPFVPAEAAASAAPALVEEESPTQLIPRALVEEESPTQLIPRALVEEESPTQLLPRALVEEESPTQLLPRALVEEESPTQLIPRAHLEEEPPTQLIPRVKVSTPQLSTKEIPDPRTADHPALDAQKVEGEKDIAEEQSDGAEDYRTRVEEAERLDDVRMAALRDVGKLERTRDQSPDFGEIWTGLDTILDLPWSTKTPDWIDIQESREVEASLRKLIKPVVGDVEEGDAAEVEAVVGDVVEGDAAEVEAVVGDVVEGDAAEVEAVVGDVVEGDAAEVEAVVGDVVEGDAAEVEAVVGDVVEGDAAEVEAVVGDVVEGDAAEVEAVVGDVVEGDAAEVEAVVGDVVEGDAAEVEAVAADTEKADRAPAGPHDDDTVVMPAVLAGFSGRVQPGPQLPEQQAVRPALVETPTEKRRYRSLALAAAALAVLLIGAVFFGASRDGSVTAQSAPTVTATATATVSKPTSQPSDEPTDSGGEESTIQLEDLADSARPFEAVRIQGTYRGGEGNFLRVQRWEGGKWVDFPLPTKTDQSGLFITQAEFGQPGRYRLRVLDPDSGVTSKPFVVVVKG